MEPGAAHGLTGQADLVEHLGQRASLVLHVGDAKLRTALNDEVYAVTLTLRVVQITSARAPRGRSSKGAQSARLTISDPAGNGQS